MFVENSFTDIERRIIPKTLLIIAIPFFPNNFSILFEDFKIIYTNIELMIIAIITLIRSNSARKESIVVKVPAPAIIGKAIGTIDAVSGSSPLKDSNPRTISRAIKKSQLSQLQQTNLYQYLLN